MIGPERVGRFDIGQVIVSSLVIVRDRWVTLALLVFGVGFTPYLVVGSLGGTDPYTGNHDLRGFAIHAATQLAPALLGHFTIAAVVRASLGPKDQAGFAAAVRSVLLATPVLLPAWLASECDTFVRLWNDWTQTVLLPTRVGPHLLGVLSLLGLDLALSVVAVGAVGVFTPVALAENLGLRGTLTRSWRLMSGSRWSLSALYIVLLAAVVFVAVVEVVAGIWLSPGVAAPSGSVHALANRAIYILIIDFWGVLVTVGYLDLRRLHEGALPDKLAEVFA
jgi:hypothetical protein